MTWIERKNRVYCLMYQPCKQTAVTLNVKAVLGCKQIVVLRHLASEHEPRISTK